MKCYSEPTGKTYDTLEELEAAESNGFVVVGVPTADDLRPWVIGPFSDKGAAKKQAVKMRRRIKVLDKRRAVPSGSRVFVRHLWKDFS